MPNARATRIVNAMTKQRGVTVEPGWGEGNLVLKIRKKIFVLLTPTTVVVKLPRARVDELVDADKGVRFDPRKNGRVMKEWLVASDQAMWSKLAKEALAFVGAAR